MNDPKMHDALDAVFGGNMSRWMTENDNTPPQSLRDGIAAVILAAFHGAMDTAELTQHLKAVEHAAWSARMTVQRLIDGI